MERLSNTETNNTTTGSPVTSSPLKPALASLFGTALEWYDYFIYGLAAGIVFGPLFFPSASPAAGTLAAFATFSVGFLARPIGGIVMGHFGDRTGRKAMLVASLLLMGIATAGIGLLPTYSDIGIWAPILLVAFRFMQGFGVGGEWGGAVLMAVEHAPESRKSFYGSFPQMGVPAGLILANIVFLLVSGTVSNDAFMSWGWRLPFLIGGVLVIAGLIMRMKLEESPTFVDVVQSDVKVRLPVVEVVKSHWLTILLISGSFIGINGVAYVFMSYLLSYTASETSLSRNLMLTVTLAASVFWLISTPLAAIQADKRSRRGVLIGGSIALALFSGTLFPAVDSANLALIIPAMCCVAIAMGIVYGPMASLFSQVFPPPIRYSGTSLSYQIGSILGGGFAPTIAAGLLLSFGTSSPITAYMVIMSIVSLVCLLVLTSSTRRVWTN